MSSDGQMSLTREQIQSVILETIARELDLPISEVHPGASLRNDLDLTSLDSMNVIMSLEDEFQREADIEAVLEFETVQQLIDYLVELLSTPPSPP